MDLVKYNKSLELPPFGFNNMGATCYFNAMLQSLFSCTAFIEELLNNKEEYNKNPITKYIIKIIELTRDLDRTSDPDQSAEIAALSPRVWKEMVVYLCRKRQTSIGDILSGQQCAREGFHCLLDALDEFRGIQNIFLHRYKTMVHCEKCNKWISDVDNMYNIFEVHPQLKTEQLEKFKQYDETEPISMEKFLTKQSSYVDKDFTCTTCKDKSEKYNRNFLIMVPEILVVLSKKYTAGIKLNVFTDFPEQLSFNGKNGTTLTYTAVSQIEHSGGLNGGHYWAISKRAGGWFTLNDNGVSPAKFAPTKNTYIVFYHLV
jgi:ubiquitin C-terminal hydrolase